jgi:WD40 repeat protein
MGTGRDRDTWTESGEAGSATIGFDGEAAEPRQAPAAGGVLTEAPGRYLPGTRGGGAREAGDDASVVGKGGLGVVLAVQDTYLGRQVALKELRGAHKGSSTAPSSAQASRFLREARVTAQLEHPSIVPVHEIGRRQDGRLYYTMKLVRGRTLAVALAEAKTLPDRLGLLGHFADMCHALAYAHSHGVVHRDVKPANVMVGEFGETVVLDWGLAKVRGEADGADDLPRPTLVEDGHTVMGTILGTPAYMSPEQAAGNVDAVGERSDTWSLGAVLFEILTGQRPYGDIGGDATVRALKEGPPPRRVREIAPEVPQDLAAIADKALSYDAAGRYPTARELAADVDAWRSGARVLAYDYSSMELLRRFVDRHRTTVAVGALALALLGALGAISWKQVVEERDRAVLAEQAALEKEAEALRHLGHALVDRARAAVREYDLHAAELYAAGALSIAEDPDARGVLTLLATSWKPVLEREIAVAHATNVMQWTPDGRTILAVGKDSLAAWDAATGEPRWRVTIPEGRARVLRVDATSSRVLTAHSDSTARVWDVASGAAIASFPGPEDAEVNSAEFAPDGTVVVAYKRGPPGAGLARWDPESGQQLAFVDDDVCRWTMRRTPDGGALVMATTWGTEIRDAITLGEKLGGGVYGADVEPDLSEIYTSDGEGRLRVWDTATRTQIAEYDTGGGAGVVVTSPDGRFVLEKRESGLVWLREARNHNPVFRFHVSDPHGGVFSPDGRRLALREGDGPIRVWDLGDEPVGRRLMDPPTAVHTLSYSYDGKLALAGVESLLTVWELPSGRMIRDLSQPSERQTGTFMEDGRIVLLSEGGTMRVLGPDLEERARYAVPFMYATPHATDDAIVGLHDGSWVRVDLATGARRILHGKVGEGWSYMISRRPGRTALGVDEQGFARVDFPTGEVKTLAGAVSGNAYIWTATPDERQLVMAVDDEVLFVDVETDQVVDRFQANGEGGLTRRMDVSPDGKLLAAGGSDPIVNVWDLSTHRLLAALRGHENRLQTVTFSPDGQWLLSNSWDGQTRLWDLSVLDVPAADALASAEKRYGLRLDGAEVVPTP